MQHASANRRPGIVARVLHALGFRFVLPIGTMPVPYHPWFVPLALVGLVTWFGWTVFDTIAHAGSGTVWWQPIPLFLVLGVLMSIPFVAWAGLVFRIPLVQGLLGAAVPVLVAIEVVAGTLSAPWLALPFAYVALFMFQLWYGPRWLARVRAQNAAFEPIAPGQATVALGWRVHQVETDLAQIDAARVWARKLSGRDGWLVHRLSLADADRIEQAAEGSLPARWSLSRGDRHATLKQPCLHPPADSLHVWSRPARAPLWAVIGLREHGVRMRREVRRLRSGGARLIHKVPLFIGFHWTAILAGKSEWHLGFPRAKPVPLDLPLANQPLRLLFEARPESGGVTDTSHVEELVAFCARRAAEARAKAAALRQRQGEFWSRLPTFEKVPADLKAHYRALIAVVDGADPAGLPDVLDWLERCREAPSQAGFYEACALMETYPDAALAAHGERIAAIFNSRKIALQWNLAEVPDRAQLPPRTPVCAMGTAGFGVFRGRPDLYARLEHAVPQLKGVSAGLAREYANPEPGLRTRGVVRSL